MDGRKEDAGLLLLCSMLFEFFHELRLKILIDKHEPIEDPKGNRGVVDEFVENGVSVGTTRNATGLGWWREHGSWWRYSSCGRM